MARDLKNMLKHNLVWFCLSLTTADSAFKFNTEEITDWVSLLNLSLTVIHVNIPRCIFVLCKLESLLERAQELSIAFFSILLFVVTLVISLVEHREYLPHGLHERIWSKTFSFTLEVFHQTTCLLGQSNVWIVSQSRVLVIKLEICEGFSKLIDSFQTLHHRVHIACVTQILETS